MLMSAGCTPTVYFSAEQVMTVQQCLSQVNGYNWVKKNLIEILRTLSVVTSAEYDLQFPEPLKLCMSPTLMMSSHVCTGLYLVE